MKRKFIQLITLNIVLVSSFSMIPLNANPEVCSLVEESVVDDENSDVGRARSIEDEQEQSDNQINNADIENEEISDDGDTSEVTEALTGDELEMIEGMSSSEFIELIQKYDSQIQINMNKLEKINENISQKEDEIKSNKNTIELLEKELKEKTELLNDRVRNIQVTGGFEQSTLQILDTLISADSVSDFISKLKFVTRSIKYDKELINNAKDTKAQIEQLQKNIEDTYNKLQKEKELVEKENLEIEEDKRKVLSYLVASNTLHNSTLNSNITFPVELLSDVSGTAKSVIEEASKYLGVPYVWGGTTPSGFDCSGLMQYCFAKYGINLPRVSQDQQNAGIKVPLDQIKPGDMVFFGYPAHHVGLYIGEGKYLHAPQTGDVVKISELNTSKVSSVGRVIL